MCVEEKGARVERCYFRHYFLISLCFSFSLLLVLLGGGMESFMIDVSMSWFSITDVLSSLAVVVVFYSFYLYLFIIPS